MSQSGREALGTVQRSGAYRGLVAIGLIVYGLVHLLIAWLAILLAFGANPEEPSQTGALRQLANAPLGEVLLLVTAGGFLAIALWQAIEATVGHRDHDGGQRLRRRLSSAGRAVVYLAFAFLAARTVLAPGADDGEEATSEASRGILGLPYGQWIIGVIGLVIVIFAVRVTSTGFTKKYRDDLDGSLSRMGEIAASLGHVAKGVAFAIIGGLAVWAAWTHDPEQVGGMDAALEVVRQQPLGRVLLVVLAMGIAAYGVYCFFWARHAKHTRVA